MRKYSFWLTSLLGVVALCVLVVGWNQIDMLHKLPIMYIVALALHETEELKLPGDLLRWSHGTVGSRGQYGLKMEP